MEKRSSSITDRKVKTPIINNRLEYMMKKKYVKPVIKVLAVEMESTILVSSVSTYDSLSVSPQLAKPAVFEDEPASSTDNLW